MSKRGKAMVLVWGCELSLQRAINKEQLAISKAQGIGAESPVAA
jgi:hypothetical protein